MNLRGVGGRRNTNFQLTYYTRGRPKIIGAREAVRWHFGTMRTVIRRFSQDAFHPGFNPTKQAMTLSLAPEVLVSAAKPLTNTP